MKTSEIGFKRFLHFEGDHKPKLHELQQRERIIRRIHTVPGSQLPWAVLLSNIGYQQVPTAAQLDSQRWKGELDLLLLARDRIVLYELKCFQGKITRGRTDGEKWILERSGRRYSCASWFDQVSRQRYYLLQTYLNSIKSDIPGGQTQHFQVDARIVVPDGFDSGRFYHKFPMTITPEDLLNITSSIPDHHRPFVTDAYSLRSDIPGELRCRKLTADEKVKLDCLWDVSGIPRRTCRWFRLIRESEVVADLAALTSSSFEIDQNTAIRIAHDFGASEV